MIGKQPLVHLFAEKVTRRNPICNLEDEVSPKEEAKTCSPNLKLFSAAAAATTTVKTTTESMTAVGDTFITDYCRTIARARERRATATDRSIVRTMRREEDNCARPDDDSGLL